MYQIQNMIKLKNEINKIRKDFPYLKIKKSVQDQVGAPLTNKFKKIKHLKPMLSLSNTFNAKWDDGFYK